MNFDKRIWKTGLLSVAVTIGFTIFAFRAAEWSKGFNSEFVVLGQTGGTGTGGSGTPGGTQVTKIVPQIVVGSYDSGISKYLTVIQIVNTGSASIDVSGNFFNTNGSPSTLSVTNVSSGASFVGTLASTSLGGNSVLVLRADTAAAGTTNWARIVTTGSASVSAYFELRDGSTNVLYNRVGVESSAADMSSFLIPRVSNVASNLDVGFALVNTGSTSANSTGTLRDASGAVIAARTIALASASHTAVFAREFFSGQGCSPCLGTGASGTSHSSVSFSSTSAQFAALALAIEGAALSSFPVERLQ